MEIAAQNELSDEEHLIKTLELISKHSLLFSETYVLNCVAANVTYQPRACVCHYLLGNTHFPKRTVENGKLSKDIGIVSSGTALFMAKLSPSIWFPRILANEIAT